MVARAVRAVDARLRDHRWQFKRRGTEIDVWPATRSPSASCGAWIGGLIGGLDQAFGFKSSIDATGRLDRDDRAATSPRCARSPRCSLTCTAIALVGWLVQVGADSGGVRADRSAPTALIEETAYGVEHGIHLTALDRRRPLPRRFAKGALGLPFPVERADDLPGGDGRFRLFAYNDVLPAYVLLPALVILLGLTALAALYAGFTVARRSVPPRSPRPRPGARSPARRGRS